MAAKVSAKALRNFVKQLQARNTHALGFLPTAALEKYISRNQLLIATENDEPCGYLVYRDKTPDPAATPAQPIERSIIQVCVVDDAQRLKHATQLVKQAANHGHQPNVDTISLWCGSKLPAVQFWHDIGFRTIGRRLGGTSHHPLHLKMAIEQYQTHTYQLGTPAPPRDALFIPPWYPPARARRKRAYVRANVVLDGRRSSNRGARTTPRDDRSASP